MDIGWPHPCLYGAAIFRQWEREEMPYKDVFEANTSNLINKIGIESAHLVWTLALYLEEPDLEALAGEALTDGSDDKKIDFIYFDRDAGRIIFAQGFYSSKNKDAAPSNKASDLNTAAAWLIAGDTKNVPSTLKAIFEECRDAIEREEVESVELFYVHNLPESVNVTKELNTVSSYLRSCLAGKPVTVQARELGNSQIEHLFSSQESHIEVKDEIECPAPLGFSESGPKWKATILTVPGTWLHQLFDDYGEALFSANYRGFLGITKRRRINTGIRSSAETSPKDFFVFNNGVTMLTYKVTENNGKVDLKGVSIINGAQTTGSLGSIDVSKSPLDDVAVLCRIIECSDDQTISNIVKYNNTQNEITTWDQYSNDPDQARLEEEFRGLGYKYSRKRGFRTKGDQIGIEELAQPLVAFHGRFRDANAGKNRIFERRPLYDNAFSGKKARHVLLVYTAARAIDEKRLELKSKSNNGSIIEMENDQLSLLRYLRFKYFLLSVIAASLEATLGRRVRVDSVAFSEASIKEYSLIELIALWAPVCEKALTFACTQVNMGNISDTTADDSAVKGVSKVVESLMYNSRNLPEIKGFAEHVVDS